MHLTHFSRNVKHAHFIVFYTFPPADPTQPLSKTLGLALCRFHFLTSNCYLRNQSLQCLTRRTVKSLRCCIYAVCLLNRLDSEANGEHAACRLPRCSICVTSPVVWVIQTCRQTICSDESEGPDVSRAACVVLALICLCLKAGTHYPSSRPVFAGRVHARSNTKAQLLLRWPRNVAQFSLSSGGPLVNTCALSQSPLRISP